MGDILRSMLARLFLCRGLAASVQSDEEFTLMLGPFAASAPGAPPVGLVDLNALLGAIRGAPLAPARAAVVNDAYALLLARKSTPGPAGPTLADLLRLSHAVRGFVLCSMLSSA